jgi:O-antigen ligase
MTVSERSGTAVSRTLTQFSAEGETSVATDFGGARQKVVFRDRLLVWTAVAAVFSMPFHLPLVNNYAVWSTEFLLVIGEIPLLVFLCVAGIHALGTFRQSLRQRRNAIVSAEFALALATGVSTLVHPSLRGAQVCWRVLALGVFGACVASGRLQLVAIVKAVIASTALQALLMGQQALTGGWLGLWVLGEQSTPFFEFYQGFRAPLGTFPHPYLAAAFALVAASSAMVCGVRRRIPPSWASVGTFSGFFIVGLTCSRAALLSVIGIFAATLVGLVLAKGDRKIRAVLLLLVIGFGSAFAWKPDVWLERSRVTTVSTSADDVTTGRLTLLKQGVQIAQLDPVFGVGPGQYLNVLVDHPEIYKNDMAKTVHNTPLLLVSEGGVLTGFALLARCALLARRLWNLGVDGAVLASAIVPFAMFDHVLATFAGGFTMLAVWVLVTNFADA